MAEEAEAEVVKVFLRDGAVVLQQGTAQIELKTRAQGIAVCRLVMKHLSEMGEGLGEWND